MKTKKNKVVSEKADGTLVFFRRSDIAVVTALLLIALTLWGLRFFAPQGEDKKIEILCDGVPIKTIALPAEDSLIALGESGQIKLEIKDNQIRFVEADCPDKTCVRSGFIDKAGQSLLCLPNRIVVRIVGESEIGVDGIVG